MQANHTMPAVLRCSARLILLAALCASVSLAAGSRARVYEARFDAVWMAAHSVAQDSFLLDNSSRDKGRLLFRTGPLRAYRFEVMVTQIQSGKTRVQLELRTNLRGLEKDAWRNAARYLDLVSKKVQGSPR